MVEDRFVILVEPEIPENTGFIARLCENFDYSLRLVNPCFNLSECRKTASSSQQILRDARIFDSLESAIEDLDFVVGTKPGKGEGLANFNVNGFESIVFGRESKGLSNNELSLCDATVHIETGSFSSLNLSHAASVVMHSFHSRSSSDEGLDKKYRNILDNFVGEKTMLKKLLMRSNPDKKEFNKLIGEIKNN